MLHAYLLPNYLKFTVCFIAVAMSVSVLYCCGAKSGHNRIQNNIKCKNLYFISICKLNKFLSKVFNF